MSNTRLKVATSGKQANAADIGGTGIPGQFLRRIANVDPSYPGDDVDWANVPVPTSVALSAVRYADLGTAIPTPDQHGTQDAPFKTLTQALAAVPAGGVIWAVPGDYSPEGLLTITKNVGIASLGPRIPDDLAGGIFMNSPNVLVDSITVGAGFTLSCVQVKTTNVAGVNVPATATAMMYSCDAVQFSGDGAICINNTHTFDIACSSCVAQNCGLDGSAITCSAGGLSVVLFDCDFANAFNVTFGAPGVLTLRGTSYPRWLLAAATITNGVIFPKTVGLRARITVAVPVTVADTTVFVDVSTVGSALEGAIAAGVPIAANPSSDIQAAGLTEGFLAYYYSSAANTIRMLFRGNLTGGNVDFDFTLL